ncbi:MAG: porin family protein [Saprospiraceae bacterium]|nr:porin family protein [Saprospiraceae bacterium]
MTFINEHFALGGYGSFFVNANNQSLSAGAIARYYIPISKRLFIYPNLGLGVSVNFFNFSDNGVKNKSNGFNLDFSRSVGFNYFLSRDLALDFNADLRFNNSSRTDEDNISTSSQVTSFDTNISFGVTYFVDKILKK